MPIERRVAICAIAVLLLWWCLQLNYNGPMIDEAFYAQVPLFGNVFNLTADARLWPTLSRWLHSWGGLLAARAGTVVLVTGAVVLLAAWVREWELLRTMDVPHRVAPQWLRWMACVLCALAPSMQFIATIATCDALALCSLAGGCVAIWAALRRRAAWQLWAGVALLCVSAASRYFYFGPVTLLLLLAVSVARARRVERWALPHVTAAVTLFFGAYFLTTGSHVMDAIAHARMDAVRYGSQDTEKSVLIELIGLMHFWGLIWGLGALTWIRSTWRVRQIRWIVLGCVLVSASPIGYHLIAGRSLNMVRDIAVWAWLGAVPAAMGVHRMWSRSQRGIAPLALLGLVLWWSAQPLVREYREWGDWRPVVAALQRYALTPETRIWSYGDYRANVWFLQQELSAQVDTASPWRYRSFDALLADAAPHQVDLIVGELWGDTRPVGAIVGGYRVVEVLTVPHSAPVSILQPLEHP